MPDGWRVQEFNFSIVHHPGKRHGNADSMSQRPCTQCGQDSHEDPPESTASVSTGPIADMSSADLRQLQLEDGLTSLLLQAVEKGEKPDAGDVRREGPEAQRLLQLWGHLTTDSGLLKRKYEDVHGHRSWQQLVVPHQVREEKYARASLRCLGKSPWCRQDSCQDQGEILHPALMVCRGPRFC